MRKVLYILGELEDEDLQWLLEAGVARRLRARSELIREGEPAEWLYIVVDGLLSVRKLQKEIARLGAGEVVGDMSLLDSRPPGASVEALQDSTVYAIPRNELRAKLDQDTEFAARFYRALCIVLANRLGRTNAMIGLASRGLDLPSEPERAVPEEIPAELLDTVALAGARFQWFLEQVRQR
jgi:CRP-like cAMP-binding protein